MTPGVRRGAAAPIGGGQGGRSTSWRGGRGGICNSPFARSKPLWFVSGFTNPAGLSSPSDTRPTMASSPPTQVLRIKTRRHWDAGLIGHNMGDSRPDHAATTGDRPPVVVLDDERRTAKRVLRKLLKERKGAPGKPPHEVVEILVAGLPRYVDMIAAGETHRDIDQRVRSWADDSLAFLRGLGGGHMQIIGAALHQDESSPHLHALFIPRTKDNKLSWRTCCGAGAHKFVEIQDAYFEQVGRKARTCERRPSQVETKAHADRRASGNRD